MIGDSHVDILTARNTGTRSIGCTFGLSPDSLGNARPDLLAHSPSDWPGLLLENTPPSASSVPAGGATSR